MKKTVQDFLEMKKRGELIAAIVIYTEPEAKAAELAGVDWCLSPGDSIAMSQGGFPNTWERPPSMDLMIEHAIWCRNGAPNTFLVGDMPLGSYGAAFFIPNNGVINAKRFIEEAGMDAIKLEGGKEMAHQVEKIANANITLMAHCGLKPQTAESHKKVYGETHEEALLLIEEVQTLIEAGAKAVLLEKVTEEVAEIIISMFPETIITGIGAGRGGQLLLGYDILGISPLAEKIKFVKCYATEENYLKFLEEIKTESFKRQDIGKSKILPTMARFTEFCFKMYVKDVKDGKFPQEKHVYHMKEGEYEKLMQLI